MGNDGGLRCLLESLLYFADFIYCCLNSKSTVNNKLDTHPAEWKRIGVPGYTRTASLPNYILTQLYRNNPGIDTKNRNWAYMGGSTIVYYYFSQNHRKIKS